MNTTQNFYLQLAEPCRENWFIPPEDPLGELSHFDMGLRRFCFEHNQKVLLEIGDEKQELFLDPDIILILDEIPEKIDELYRGKKNELDFPESRMIIYLEPRKEYWRIGCTWRKYGYSIEEKSFELERKQLFQMLKTFVKKILTQAVDKGYIQDREKTKFMKRMVKR
ncbi:hypothetical protein [Nostoc sp.]|uniref:hypothetical protein n=1 Tax=Nostoc sp. TaxID=1180 RepID=UPI002FF821D1